MNYRGTARNENYSLLFIKTTKFRGGGEAFKGPPYTSVNYVTTFVNYVQPDMGVSCHQPITAPSLS